MKKVSYFLGAALLMAASYVCVSCGGEDAASPEIEVILNKTVQNSVDAKVGDVVEVKVTWKAEGKIDKIELEKEDVDGSGGNVSGYPKTSDFKPSDTQHEESFNFTCEKEGTVKFTAKVTDKNDGDAGAQTKSQTFTIVIGKGEPETTPLDAEADLKWERTGSNIDMGNYGVKWISNTTAGKAELGPESGAKLVVLTASDWTGITTKEALKDKVDAETGVTSWKEIGTGSGATFNHVLATKTAGGTYYLINLTKSTVENVTAGTKITITGKSKK